MGGALTGRGPALKTSFGLCLINCHCWVGFRSLRCSGPRPIDPPLGPKSAGPESSLSASDEKLMALAAGCGAVGRAPSSPAAMGCCCWAPCSQRSAGKRCPWAGELCWGLVLAHPTSRRRLHGRDHFPLPPTPPTVDTAGVCLDLCHLPYRQVSIPALLSPLGSVLVAGGTALPGDWLQLLIPLLLMPTLCAHSRHGKRYLLAAGRESTAAYCQ